MPKYTHKRLKTMIKEETAGIKKYEKILRDEKAHHKTLVRLLKMAIK